MATIPYTKKNPQDRYYRSLGEDNAANWAISDSLKPNFQLGGGVYRLAAQTYADGDDVAFNFDVNGYLLCKLKSAIEVSGDLAVDVWSYQLTDGTDANAWVFTHDADLSAVSEVWQGFGGYDETADRFRALPIATDNAAMPADAQGLPIMGEYNATPVVYGDGDATILQTDASGHLVSTSDAIHAEDTAHTTGDEGNFMLAVRNDAGTSMVDTDGDYAPLQVNANGMLNVNLDNIRDAAPEVGAGNAGAATLRVSISTDDVNLSAIKTATELIDDAVFADSAAFTPATSKGLAVGGVYEATITDVTDGDFAAQRMTLSGSSHVRDDTYDSATSSNKVSEVSPISAHHVEETLIDETNITTNTTTYAYLDMDGYKFLTIQGETSGTAPTDVLTVTIEASCQDDGTAAASCAYQDVTTSWYGVASWEDLDFFAEKDVATAVKYVRVKYVTSNGAGNDADLTVYAKRMY